MKNTIGTIITLIVFSFVFVFSLNSFAQTTASAKAETENSLQQFTQIVTDALTVAIVGPLKDIEKFRGEYLDSFKSVLDIKDEEERFTAYIIRLCTAHYLFSTGIDTLIDKGEIDNQIYVLYVSSLFLKQNSSDAKERGFSNDQLSELLALENRLRKAIEKEKDETAENIKWIESILFYKEGILLSATNIHKDIDPKDTEMQSIFKKTVENFELYELRLTGKKN